MVSGLEKVLLLLFVFLLENSKVTSERTKKGSVD